jgi:DNA-binding transcriptional ArsR family regulator
MYKDLDPVLHSQLRLAIMSILVSVEEADFSYIKEKTGATSGNISVQVSKLKEAGYIEVIKKFKGNYPQTLCKVSRLGIQKFEEYIEALKFYLRPGQQENSDR